MFIRYAVPVLLASVAATFAVIAPGNSTAHIGTPGKAKDVSAKVPPPDVERVIRLTGLTPEAFAAAGFIAVDTNTLFDSATVYCLQSDRLAEFEARISAFNIAVSNAAIDPEKWRPLPGGGQVPSVPDAKSALQDLRTSAFEFMTSQLEPNKVATLAQIVSAGRTWELPVEYLAATRTDAAGIELRGALSTKASLARRGLPQSQAVNAVVAAADAEEGVQSARQSLSSGLPVVKETWTSRSTTPIGP